MLVKDVDIIKIYELLKSVPPYMEIKSIDLTDGYSLNLNAGTKELKNFEYHSALAELNDILEEFRKADKRINSTDLTTR